MDLDEDQAEEDEAQVARAATSKQHHSVMVLTGSNVSLFLTVESTCLLSDFCSAPPSTPQASGKSIYAKQVALLVYM